MAYISRFIFITFIFIFLAGCGRKTGSGSSAIPDVGTTNAASTNKVTGTGFAPPITSGTSGSAVPARLKFTPLAEGSVNAALPPLPGYADAQVAVERNVFQRIVLTRATTLKDGAGVTRRAAKAGEILYRFEHRAAADSLLLVGVFGTPEGFVDVADTVPFRNPQGLWLSPDVEHFGYATAADAEASCHGGPVKPIVSLARGRAPFLRADPLTEARKAADGTWLYRVAVFSEGSGSPLTASEETAVKHVLADARHISLALVVDATLSMTGTIHAVQETLASTVKELQSGGTSLSVAVFVYRDYPVTDMATFEKVLDFTTAPAEIDRGIRAMKACTTSSGDWKEAVQAGIIHSRSELNWDGQPKAGARVCWIIGDNAGRVQGTAADPSNDQVLQAMAGMRLCTTFVAGSCDVPSEIKDAKDQFQDLARRGNGLYLQLDETHTPRHLAAQLRQLVSDTDRENAQAIRSARTGDGNEGSARGTWKSLASRLTPEELALLRRSALAADAGDGRVHQFAWIAVPPAKLAGATPIARVVELASLGQLKNALQELQQARAMLGTVSNAGDVITGSARESSSVLRHSVGDLGLPIASELLRGAYASIAEPDRWAVYLDLVIGRLQAQIAAAREAHFDIGGVRSIWIDSNAVWGDPLDAAVTGGRK